MFFLYLLVLFILSAGKKNSNSKAKAAESPYYEGKCIKCHEESVMLNTRSRKY